MKAIPYFGELARWAAEWLNAEWPDSPPICRVREGLWSALRAETPWDRPLGREPLTLSDETVVALAIDQGGDAFHDWVERAKRRLVSA